ncbi:MAG: hypothetical protein LBT01_07825, partial [Spirochaetaceae bacterium]|nr:hypothetical protein [Spirochaetaceae bacterium]
EDLKQINVRLLFGEESRLPVYQTIYSGSLKDVSTLICTLHLYGKGISVRRKTRSSLNSSGSPHHMG